MRKSLFACLPVVISCVVSPSALSLEVNPEHPAFEVGIENNRLIFGKMTLERHFTAKLNISAYSEKLAFQYIRGTIGYHTEVQHLSLDCNYFFGSSFNGYYYNTGAVIQGNLKLLKKLLVDLSLVPWYDSGYGYTTCYQGKIGWQIIPNIALKAGYTTIPEYRMSEHRALVGFDFNVSHLYVTPYLSIGTKENEGGKNIRIIMGFGYKF